MSRLASLATFQGPLSIVQFIGRCRSRFCQRANISPSFPERVPGKAASIAPNLFARVRPDLMNLETDHGWLYAFRYGGIKLKESPTGAVLPFVLLKVGIIEPGGKFPAVLKRLYHHLDFAEKNFGTTKVLDIPVNSNLNSPEVPLASRKVTGAAATVHIAEYDELLSRVRPDSDVPHSHLWADLLFILPFTAKFQPNHIHVLEPLLRFSFGDPVFSDFADNLLALRQGRNPALDGYLMPHTEIVVCPAPVFDDTRDLWIAGAFDNVQQLIAKVPLQNIDPGRLTAEPRQLTAEWRLNDATQRFRFRVCQAQERKPLILSP